MLTAENDPAKPIPWAAANPAGFANCSASCIPVVVLKNGRAKIGTPDDEAKKELAPLPRKKPPTSSPQAWQSSNQYPPRAVGRSKDCCHRCFRQTGRQYPVGPDAEWIAGGGAGGQQRRQRLTANEPQQILGRAKPTVAEAAIVAAAIAAPSPTTTAIATRCVATSRRATTRCAATRRATIAAHAAAFNERSPAGRRQLRAERRCLERECFPEAEGDPC